MSNTKKFFFILATCANKVIPGDVFLEIAPNPDEATEEQVNKALVYLLKEVPFCSYEKVFTPIDVTRLSELKTRQYLAALINKMQQKDFKGYFITNKAPLIEKDQLMIHADNLADLFYSVLTASYSIEYAKSLIIYLILRGDCQKAMDEAMKERYTQIISSMPNTKKAEFMAERELNGQTYMHIDQEKVSICSTMLPPPTSYAVKIIFGSVLTMPMEERLRIMTDWMNKIPKGEMMRFHEVKHDESLGKSAIIFYESRFNKEYGSKHFYFFDAAKKLMMEDFEELAEAVTEEKIKAMTRSLQDKSFEEWLAELLSSQTRLVTKEEISVWMVLDVQMHGIMRFCLKQLMQSIEWQNYGSYVTNLKAQDRVTLLLNEESFASFLTNFHPELVNTIANYAYNNFKEFWECSVELFPINVLYKSFIWNSEQKCLDFDPNPIADLTGLKRDLVTSYVRSVEDGRMLHKRLFDYLRQILTKKSKESRLRKIEEYFTQPGKKSTQEAIAYAFDISLETFMTFMSFATGSGETSRAEETFRFDLEMIAKYAKARSPEKYADSNKARSPARWSMNLTPLSSFGLVKALDLEPSKPPKKTTPNKGDIS